MNERNSRNDIKEQDTDSGFGNILGRLLRIFFRDALRISLTRPSQAYFFLRTVMRQRKAARTRASWQEKGSHVPPIALFSITNRCNLHCKGCYSWALHKTSGQEMSREKMMSVLEEARELGILFFALAGGEPFVRREVLDITKEFPEIIFLIFTNGLLIDEELLMKMKKQKNIVPVLSLEGYEEETDGRRGKGVYEGLEKVIQKLKRNGIFYSVSVTLTRNNYESVTDDQFINNLVALGCKLFFFVEYSPVQEGTEDWIVTDGQRDDIMNRIKAFRKKFRSLFIAVPGDEEEIGGCLSAGRGFIHISATGDIEPCPFAPYSDTNLRESTLKDALQSRFLRTIRENHDQLRETEGGCALWAKRHWVRSLLDTK